MLETVSLAAFMIGLFVCLLSGISLVYALMAGYLIFFGYGLVRGHGVAELLRMSGSGVRKVRNILITFGLIGMLTALWRAAGTIPAVVSYSSQLIRPSAFFMFVFLLNCLVSVLTGTSLGTAATMGVICMAIGSAMRMSPVITGGAVISGAYFGDRCSPVSTSALLVCELTGTDIYDNIRRMAASSVLPLGLTCLLYYLMGIAGTNGGVTLNVRPIFERGFVIHWLAVLPAAVILILSVFRVKVRMTLSVSIAVAFLTGMFLQHTGPLELLKTAVYGYRAADPELAAMMNGGGMMSMVRLAVIITISSSYAGLFEGTHLLDQLKLHMEGGGQKLYALRRNAVRHRRGGGDRLQSDPDDYFGSPALLRAGAGARRDGREPGKYGCRCGASDPLVHRSRGPAGLHRGVHGQSVCGLLPLFAPALLPDREPD